MEIDQSILNPRRWIALGVIVFVLLAGVSLLITLEDARQPATTAQSAPVWIVGVNARVPTALDAARAAGPASLHGVACRMASGAVGKIIEIGGPLSDPRGYVELSTPGCTGWVSVYRIAPPPAK